MSEVRRAAVAALVVSCLVWSPAAWAALVSGVVGHDGEPVAGAVVRLKNAAGVSVTVLTDAEGVYHANVPGGVWTVEAYKASLWGDTEHPLDLAPADVVDDVDIEIR